MFGPTGFPLESVTGPHAGVLAGQSVFAFWQRHCWPVNDPGAKHTPLPFGSVLFTGMVQHPFAPGQTGMIPLVSPSADAEHVCAQTMFPVPSLTHAEPALHGDAHPPLPPLLDPLPLLLPDELPLLLDDPPSPPDVGDEDEEQAHANADAPTASQTMILMDHTPLSPADRWPHGVT